MYGGTLKIKGSESSKLFVPVQELVQPIRDLQWNIAKQYRHRTRNFYFTEHLRRLLGTFFTQPYIKNQTTFYGEYLVGCKSRNFYPDMSTQILSLGNSAIQNSYPETDLKFLPLAIGIRVPKVLVGLFDKLKNEIQNSIRFCFYFNKEDKIHITDYHFHV